MSAQASLIGPSLIATAATQTEHRFVLLSEAMGDEIEFFAGLLAWILGGLLQIALERVSSIVHGLPGQGAGALALGIAGLGLAWLFFKLVKMLIIFACVAAIGALAIRFVLA